LRSADSEKQDRYPVIWKRFKQNNITCSDLLQGIKKGSGSGAFFEEFSE
jgi:hypothetical protein